MTFEQKLDALMDKNNSLLCVGIDPNMEKLPEVVKKEKYPQFVFNKAIIDATHDLVCAYKPNSAFYEACGSDGMLQLKMTSDYLKEKYPEIPVIFDAKRADIGDTNKSYAAAIFDYYNFDAVTLHPYVGREGLKPFLNRKDRGCIILCRTSNPGAGEFQDLKVAKGQTLYQYLAKQVATGWNENNNCLLVVGATYPKELAEIRAIVGEMTLLVPGIGVQGGDIEQSVKAGMNSQKKGMILNTARSIIFAGSGPDFAQQARNEAMKTRDLINQHRR